LTVNRNVEIIDAAQFNKEAVTLAEGMKISLMSPHQCVDLNLQRYSITAH